MLETAEAAALGELILVGLLDAAETALDTAGELTLAGLLDTAEAALDAGTAALGELTLALDTAETPAGVETVLDPTASLLLTRTLAALAEELVLGVLGNAEDTPLEIGVRVEGLTLAVLPAATDEATFDVGGVALGLALAVLPGEKATLELVGLTIDEELA